MYPMNGIVNMALPMTFSFLTIHWSGALFASPFVMNPSFVMLMILWVIDVDPESLKQMMFFPFVDGLGSYYDYGVFS